ncbi:MAG: hypothetical protein V7780_06895 [Colwellia sp.]|jgi:hypothetical protein|uniref:hypothetical protein n=1 Tax=Colwellia sp. Bg11-12 TaxID=2759817 RepID=UPI0015F6D4F7|nr:hypothetical protein [Colwellia sp. Bg11-12]MBA6262190.1 hypothetical protein [Colwellia sp. Bg11-12]
MVEIFWNLLGKHSNQIAIIIALIPITWGIIQYLFGKRLELKQQRFVIYHDLIKLLVQREDPKQPIMMDRQIAIIFELRNFKDYYPVTLRILTGLKKSWENYKPEEKISRARLHEELDLSIEFISNKI